MRGVPEGLPPGVRVQSIHEETREIQRVAIARELLKTA
jgi:hypothetical protein